VTKYIQTIYSADCPRLAICTAPFPISTTHSCTRGAMTDQGRKYEIVIKSAFNVLNVPRIKPGRNHNYLDSRNGNRDAKEPVAAVRGGHSVHIPR
jgi:hypothetical protein